MKVTDPEAFNRLMKDMQEKAERKKKEEEEREAERKRREGDAYRDPEQRKKDAEEARKKYALDEGDAGSVGRKFDPHKDYFKILGVDRCASQAEIKAAYKRLALQYHPDKQRNATPMQKEAINEKFKELIEAYDVLMDETLRECYDKARDYIKRNPGATSAPLSEEEQRMRARGIAEFARLRRQKGKIHTNAPTEKQVWVSMEKMHSGCMKTVEHSRRRIDEHGFEYDSQKHYHLVIRKGSRDGIKHEFESEGDETVDSLPGDLVFVLRTKPHPKFKRSGKKNLELVGTPPSRGDVWAFEQVHTLNRKVLCCYANVMEASLLQGGKGGNVEVLLQGEGCYDPDDPWGQPAGDLKVRIRYPPLPLQDMVRKTPLGFKPLMLLPSAHEELPASVVGSMLHADSLAWMEKQGMEEDQGSPIIGLHVCFNATGKASRAADVVLGSTPWICWTTVILPIDQVACTAETLLDEEFVASYSANAIMIDMEDDVEEVAQENPWRKATAESEPGNWSCSAELLLSKAVSALQCSGLWKNLFLRLCMGARFVGVGHGCSMAGIFGSSGPANQGWCILPHLVRIGGDVAGWGLLHAAVLQGGEEMKGLGAMVGSLLSVDPNTGHAEIVVVPRPDTLLHTAEAIAREGSSGVFRWCDELEDEEDEGFQEKCTYKVVAESTTAA